MNLGLLVLRATVGPLFAGHGAQKGLGWWGGPGFAGWVRITALARAILGAVAATWWPAPAPRQEATHARSA